MPQDLTPYEDPNAYRGGSFTVRGQPITSEQIAGYGAPPGLSTAGFVPEVGSASAPWATPGPRTGSPSSQLAIQPTRWMDVAPSAGYLQSPSGPRGASMQPIGDRFGGMLRGIRELLPQYQQQSRTIRTTDPGAGYGMSPSGPTAQMPARRPQIQQPQAQPRQNVTEQFSVPANYGQSPSNPNWRAGPTRTPKPMSPFYEPPVPFRPPTGGP